MNPLSAFARCCLAFLSVACLSGCSLITVPIETAGKIVTTTVETTGTVVTAPFRAGGKDNGQPPAEKED